MEIDRINFFIDVGLNKKAANEIANNPELSDELYHAIKVAGDNAKKLRSLLHTFAINTTQGYFGDQKDLVLHYIVTGKIDTYKRLRAATHYCMNNTLFDVESFETTIGLGVIVTKEEIRQVTRNLLEIHAEIVKDKECEAKAFIMKNAMIQLEWADPMDINEVVSNAMGITARAVR